MSLLDRINEEYNGLVSGTRTELNKFVLQDAERAFFADCTVYLRRFLGVFYFFKAEFLLAYSFLREEKDPVSKFYALYSLFALRYYRESAIAAFFREFDQNILNNETINLQQRVRLAFLLGTNAPHFKEGVSDDSLSLSILKLINDFAVFSNDETVTSSLFESKDPLLINEYYRRKKANEKSPSLTTHKHFFDDGFVKLHSNCTIIGNNMYLLKIKNTSVIIDCGADTQDSHIDFNKFFEEAGEKKEEISAVFFTHAHLDHVGNARSLLSFLGNTVNYYLTIDTQNLAAYGNQVNLDGRKLRYISYNTTVQISDDVNVTFIQNGHILGSTALIFMCEGKSIFYTSDFCLHNQRTVKGMNLYQLSSFVGGRIDYLITESTYGKKTDTIDYEHSVILLQKVLDLLQKYGKKAFFPAYAIGRTQEIINILGECQNPQLLINVLGSANNVTLYYVHLEKCTSKKIFNDREKPLDYDVVIASSGMLQEETESHSFVTKMLEENVSEIAFIQTGYMPPNQEGSRLIDEWKKSGKLYFKISLSAHASNSEIHKLIDFFEVGTIITIHGDGLE